MPLFKTWLGTDVSVPTDYSDADNWLSSGAAGIPAAGDWVNFLANLVSVTAGLNQSAIVLGNFNISDAYAGRIGTTGLAAGAYLRIASPLVDLHTPSGTNATGSDLIKLDLGSSTAAAVTVHGSSRSVAESGLEPIRLIGTNAGNKLYMLNGTVGIATSVPGEVATFSEANLRAGVLRCGEGVTLGTLLQDGGIANLYCGATTITQNGGNLTTTGSGTVTTANIQGNAVLNSTGTITTMNVRDGGAVDLIQNRAARTITTLNLYKGARIIGDTHVTVTNFRLIQCGMEDVDIQWGKHRAITLAVGP
jgi:hypothetical protein